METIEKIDIRKMKSDIKIKVEEQLFYKDQRKTVHRKGEYKISPSEATWKHMANRHTLRLMYAAYGLARGKSFVQIEPNSKWEKKFIDSTFDECHPLRKYMEQIDKILNGYKILVPVEIQE
jgi:hypothetical protein